MIRRAVLAVIGTALVVGCGSQAAPAAPPSIVVQAAPLATSLVTAQGAWATAVMGGPAGSPDGFWQLFARPAGADRWSLVTPPGVADNGGLVATGGAGGASLLVGVRPSQYLAFSPLATSSDTGQSWTPGLLDAALADVPDALAVGALGRVLALLHDGGIDQAPSGAAAAAGQWSQLTTLGALAASAPGRSCGLAAVNAVSFGPNDTPIAAGSCLRRGVAGIFADSGGVWQAIGPTLPARVRGGSGAGPRAGADVRRQRGAAARRDGPAGGVAGRDALDGVGSGPGGRGASPRQGSGRAGASGCCSAAAGRRPSPGPGQSWRALPPVPAGTATLAPGTGGGYDALAVSRSKLTVWRLAASAWAKVQVINVPIQYGSSG